MDSREAFEKYADQYDNFGDEWQDMGLDRHFIAGYEAGQASFQALECKPVAVVDRVGIMHRLSPYTNLSEGTKLYTHPASDEVELLQSQVDELHAASMFAGMYQDAEGTIPVTKSGQSVGRVTHKGLDEVIWQSKAGHGPIVRADVTEGWIKCSERMPNTYEAVACIAVSATECEFGYLTSGTLHENHGFYVFNEDGEPCTELREVTHWMPLPALPTKDQSQ